jgi:hypothetical protein
MRYVAKTGLPRIVFYKDLPMGKEADFFDPDRPSGRPLVLGALTRYVGTWARQAWSRLQPRAAPLQGARSPNDR